MGLIIVLFVSIIKIILEVFRYRLIVLKAIFPKRIDWIKGNMYIRIQVGIKRITDRTGKKRIQMSVRPSIVVTRREVNGLPNRNLDPET